MVIDVIMALITKVRLGIVAELTNPFVRSKVLEMLVHQVASQGHQELSGESDENNPLKPNQSAPSIYIMIELCYFSLDQ